MSSSDLFSEVRGGELHLTLNRPEHGNGASDAMAFDLAGLLRGAEERAWVVVLRGSGDDFCVGRQSMAGSKAAAPPEALARRRSSEVIFDCYQAFRDCNVPIIGVVQGRAFGFGCSIAALCDITLASGAATFQIPEMSHNILPTMVMSALVDRVGLKAVQYLVYSGAIIGADRALTMNIASDVVPAAELNAAVDDLLAIFAKAPKAALLGVKEYTRSAYDMTTRPAVDFARNLHATINSASEMRKH